jgi:hypothetical protein
MTNRLADGVPATPSFPRRIVALTAAVLVSLSLGAGVVSAAHTQGTLACGSAGTFAVDGRGPLPTGIDAPVPWSGVFLLEGTTRVFHATSIEGQGFPYNRPAHGAYPGPVIGCTLTSSGPMFPTPWTLEGFFTG